MGCCCPRRKGTGSRCRDVPDRPYRSRNGLQGHAASKYGIQIVIEESYGAKDTDMTAQLTKTKARPDVQAVFVFGTGQGPAVVTRNYRQQAMTRPLYQSYAVCSNEFIRLVGDAADGIRLPCTAMLVTGELADSDPQNAVVSGYAKSYETPRKSKVSHFGGCAYDALMIYLDAVKRAGTTCHLQITWDWM